MKTIIVDDEIIAIEVLKKAFESIPEIELVETFTSAIQATKFINTEKVDLVFLDIHMKEFTGMDMIEMIKDPPNIIMTSGDSNFAANTYEYDFVVDYIVKPVTVDRIKKALNRAQTNLKPTSSNSSSDAEVNENLESHIYVNIDRRLIKIDLNSIEIVKANGDYIKIITSNKNYTVHVPLKRIEEKLPLNRFMKVHRSYIINIDKIIDIEDNSVLIQREVIPVSKNFRAELRDKLNML